MYGCEDVPNPYEGFDEEIYCEEEYAYCANMDNELDDVYEESINSEIFLLDDISENEIYSCDACNRDFPTQNLFDKHMSEHRVCKIDGCMFTAHEKIIEAHIAHQHSTGLYDRIRNYNTPEDIAKWVEQRKNNHPCGKNRDIKNKQQEELLERGVRIGDRNNRFGKDKTRLARTDPKSRRQNRKKDFRKNSEKTNRIVRKYLPKTLIDEKADWNGNMFPFRGTKELFMEEEGSRISDFEDEEWNDKSSHTKSVNSKEVKINASLGALMGAYGSTDEEDEENTIVPNSPQYDRLLDKDKIIIAQKGDPHSVIKNFADNKIEFDAKVTFENEICKNRKNNIESDDEAPLEIKINKHVRNNNESTTVFESKIGNADCKQVSNTDKHEIMKRKRKRNAHDNKTNDSHVYHINRQKLPKSDFPYHNFKKRRITLLEKLLDKEIRHERNILLQVVKYVVENEFFINESPSCV